MVRSQPTFLRGEEPVGQAHPADADEGEDDGGEEEVCGALMIAFDAR